MKPLRYWILYLVCCERKSLIDNSQIPDDSLESRFNNNIQSFTYRPIASKTLKTFAIQCILAKAKISYTHFHLKLYVVLFTLL